MNNHTLKAWINASRLRTLPLAIAGILLGSLIAASDNHFSATIFTLALITTLLLQILSNWANDFGDFSHGVDNKNRIGPARTLQSGAIAPATMKKAIISISILALLCGIALLYMALNTILNPIFALFLLIGIGAIAAAIKYTIGNKPFGYNGLGDIMVFIFFGLASVLGCYFLHSKTFNLWVLLPAASIGFLSAGVLNLNNMRDHQNDKSSGKKTLVVRLGIQQSKLYHLALLSDALLCMAIFMYTKLGWIGLLCTLASGVPIGIHGYRSFQVLNEKEFDPQLKILSLGTFAVATINGLALWLI